MMIAQVVNPAAAGDNSLFAAAAVLGILDHSSPIVVVVAAVVAPAANRLDQHCYHKVAADLARTGNSWN